MTSLKQKILKQKAKELEDQCTKDIDVLKLIPNVVVSVKATEVLHRQKLKVNTTSLYAERSVFVACVGS